MSRGCRGHGAVIATGTKVIVSYDLADDSVWGLGIGCSGAVDIRIERLEDDNVTRAWMAVALSAASARVEVFAPRPSSAA